MLMQSHSRSLPVQFYLEIGGQRQAAVREVIRADGDGRSCVDGQALWKPLNSVADVISTELVLSARYAAAGIHLTERILVAAANRPMGGR